MFYALFWIEDSPWLAHSGSGTKEICQCLEKRFSYRQNEILEFNKTKLRQGKTYEGFQKLF